MINKLMALVALVFLCSFGNVQAQTASGGAGLGFAKLTGELGENGSFGFNYFLEGNYYVMDQLAVGIELNFSILGYGNEESFIGISAYGASEYLVKGTYFFTDGTVRPYGGLGLGLAKISTPEFTVTDGTGTSQTLEGDSKINFAISPRVGVMFGGFGLDFTYNLAGKTPTSENFNVATNDQAFNYYAITGKYIYTF